MVGGMGGWVGLQKLITDLDMRNGHKGGVRVGFMNVNEAICTITMSVRGEHRVVKLMK